ncbi:MAG: dihydroorotate dehydrogenase [Clostridia bacterium]|nr:dihydroorotate dehydrogenase [Clostridia bacterium]
MVNTKIMLNGIEIDNPVIPASGTFAFGYEFAPMYDLDILGSMSLKGTTAQARFGNPTPRIAETPSGMLNSVGLQNPGVDAVIREELPKLEKVFHKKAVANISGFSVEEYVECAEKFDACDAIGWLEINISCPNVHGGGMSFGTDPCEAAKVTAAVKKAVKKPVWIKLTPNVTDIAQVAKACEEEGADAVSMINTILGMRIDPKTRKPILANTMGGLSGPAVFPVALRMVWQVFEKISIPIVGMGGVASARDVIEMMLAGATAVQVGAANLVDPWACEKIIRDLPRVMEELKIENLSDIIGGAH